MRALAVRAPERTRSPTLSPQPRPFFDCSRACLRASGSLRRRRRRSALRWRQICSRWRGRSRDRAPTRVRAAPSPRRTTPGSLLLSLLLFALTVPCLLLRGRAGPSGGAPVNFMSLGSPAGNLVDTPMGNARMNPCSKVTICDALQPGSICCIQVNDTAHPGSGSWVSCGTTPTFTTHMAESSMVVGMILTNGADCGYVFASGAKVTASIAFTCDR